MIRLSLGLYEERGGSQIAEWAGRAVNVVASSNEHGFEALTFEVPMPLLERFRFYDLAPTKYLALSYGGGVVWEGRVEDREITASGLRLTGYGFWRALVDVPYTALWSKSGTEGWETTTQEQASFVNHSRYSMDNNNRIFISPDKNAAFTSGQSIGEMYFVAPDGGSRPIVSVSFDFEFNMAAAWTIRLVARNADFSSGAVDWSLVGDGTSQVGSVVVDLSTARNLVALSLRPGNSFTHTGENGDSFFKATNIRIVTSAGNAVDTTTTTTISAGSQVVTPASMANIYVGQRLIIDSGEATSESVAVTAVTTTTFTATFVNGYSGTTTIQAHVVYANQIIADLVSHVTAVNPAQLSASTAIVESPELDLLDVVYEDALPADIAADLALLGDNSTPPQRYEVGVFDDQRLFSRPRGSAAKSWYVDLQVPTVNSTLNTLVNETYAVYQDANGRTLRTAINTNDESVSRYGITRRAAVPVRTTSATQAAVHRDTRLNDGAVITPQGNMVIKRLFDQPGAQYPVWLARPGDTITARNLPPIASEEIDKIRTFTVARVDFDADFNQITVVPEEPLPQLEFLIARESLA